jgi:hypothetical protein
MFDDAKRLRKNVRMLNDDERKFGGVLQIIPLRALLVLLLWKLDSVAAYLDQAP